MRSVLRHSFENVNSKLGGADAPSVTDKHGLVKRSRASGTLERAGFARPICSTHVAEGLSRACSIEATKESIFAMKKNVWRAVVEVGFIIFLF